MSNGLSPISNDWVSPHWQNWQPREVAPATAHDNQSPKSKQEEEDLPRPYHTYVEPTYLPPGVSPGNYHGVPDGPPPGLVRVVPPVPLQRHDHFYDEFRDRPPRIITEADITLFGDMAKYLGGFDVLNGNPVVLDLTCNICSYRKLDVPACVAPRLDAEEWQEAEPFTVLPCGHFFGSPCLLVWLRTKEEEAARAQIPYDPQCPYCRCPLTYEKCKHPLKLRQYDPRFPRANQTPPTFPEGGVIANDCETCARQKLERVAGEIVQRVYPTELPHEAWRDPDQCNSSTFDMLRDRIWDDIFYCYNWAQSKIQYW
ncbi:hypothetical protein F4821DRAFT_276845 [Hypoxylon rubiginosum]|uniref:Uncharacterized protein n=1 Tax=Hypoxylon rubiginosum TaxID=110542 RepID=A0ACC0DKG0_9PEZI|nr:hypothetical protein F4821DRAFT_276845 [Hypoxylon rubiginosum]